MKKLSISLLFLFITLTANANDGYKLWLQYFPFENQAVSDYYRDYLENINLVGASPTIDIIQKELEIEVQIMGQDFPEIHEVDVKLLKLAQMIRGTVVTNDYNLNKVAGLQGVKVLNINELANAIKPVVLPGEEMQVEVIKDGKESGQGLAYLDDGTMIVVEGGRKLIGQETVVLVTSVLQTAAGRMIFAKPKNHES